MNQNATVEKMQSMKLLGMKRAYEASFDTNDKMTNDEFLAWLIEAEYDDRTNRKTDRLIKYAKFRYQASIEEICYDKARNLDKNHVQRLADCSYIDRGENVIITGCTGVGKSFLATALGYQACFQGYRVMYVNLGKLFVKLSIAKADGSYLRELMKIEKSDVLIIDDFGLQSIDSKKQLMLLDIIEDRHNNKSTIFTSQMPVNVWHELLSEKTIADAILDRIVHSAHCFEINGESMRKKKTNK